MLLLELLLLAHMHQIVCRLGLCPRPTGGGAYIAPPGPIAGLGGAHGKREGGRGGEKEGREGRDEKAGKGVPECPNPELASLLGGRMLRGFRFRLR